MKENRPSDTVSLTRERKVAPAEMKEPVAETIIRLGVFKVKSNAETLLNKAETRYPGKGTIIIDGGMYKVELHFPGTTDENAKLLDEIRKAGFTDAYLLRK